MNFRTAKSSSCAKACAGRPRLRRPPVCNRAGSQREDVEVGKRIKAEGYPSTVRQNEMRAERVTVGSRVIEMR